MSVDPAHPTDELLAVAALAFQLGAEWTPPPGTTSWIEWADVWAQNARTMNRCLPEFPDLFVYDALDRVLRPMQGREPGVVDVQDMMRLLSGLKDT